MAKPRRKKTKIPRAEPLHVEDNVHYLDPAQTQEEEHQRFISSWHALSRVLIVERRECACGAVYDCPSPTIKIEYQNRYSIAQRLTRDPIPNFPHPINLPIYTRYHNGRELPACPRCIENTPPDQLSLWEVPRPLTYRQPPRQFLGDTNLSGSEPRPTAKATPLSLDFF